MLDFFSGNDKTNVEDTMSNIRTEDPEPETEDKTQKNLDTTSIQIGQCVKVRSGYRIYGGLTGTVVAEPRPGRYDVKLDETLALKSKTIRMDPKDFKIIQWSKEYKSVKDRADVEEDGIRVVDEWRDDYSVAKGDVEEDGIRVVDEWRDDDSGAKGADSTKREERRRGAESPSHQSKLISRGYGDHQVPDNRMMVTAGKVVESEQSDGNDLLGKQVMVMNGPCTSQVGVVRSHEGFPEVQVELEKNGVKVMASFLRDQLKVIGRGDVEPEGLKGGTELTGCLVRIMAGPHKSSEAVVKEVYDDAVQVQLKSSGAIIVLKRNHVKVREGPFYYETLNTNDSIPQTDSLTAWSKWNAVNSARITPSSANVSNSSQKVDKPCHHESESDRNWIESESHNTESNFLGGGKEWRQGKKRKRGRPRKGQAKIGQASSGQKLTMSRNPFPYSQLTHWPPIPTGDPLPGNPAHQAPPQNIGCWDISGSDMNNSGDAIADRNTGVSTSLPGLTDRNATKRDGVQSQLSSDILPEDEDTFRQYLRSVNQGRDNQSARSSQLPQQGSFSRRW